MSFKKEKALADLAGDCKVVKELLGCCPCESVKKKWEKYVLYVKKRDLIFALFFLTTYF